MTTKIHTVVEGLGNAVRWCLTGGQVHDVTQAVALLAGLPAGTVMADKAYDADALLAYIAENKAVAVIPPRANRTQLRAYDEHLYTHRNLIERCFCRLKHFRRIATRYDKLAQRFSSFIALVAAFVWLM